ncbi:MAG TPA: pyruvoyl-dependent arginine decarboxylase [Thermoplasmata archaeon]|nr:pyruvoyl-dependent arginine decarboxylase [Thermoplasmata archaeon]
MLPLPTQFFPTSGKAISPVSDLNAFDQALVDAKIGDLNIVTVSSILPENIKQIAPKDLPRGAITHMVLAQQRGNEGEMISAGIAWTMRDDDAGGYIVEGHMHGTQKRLREVLKWKLETMAELRQIGLRKVRYKVEELSIPMDNYGVVLGACVFVL